jgi:hypothetical protein
VSAPSADVPGPMWHVTVTVAGEPVPAYEVHSGLERLAHAHPFLLAARYAGDRAEVSYWEEAPDVAAVLDLAAHLWEEHRESSVLPSWEVVGVEVVDRDTFRQRSSGQRGKPVSPVAVVGVTPF